MSDALAHGRATALRLASHEAVHGSFSKCLLLYSGGLDTSVMLKWIQEQYGCEVVALTIDIGQTADDLGCGPDIDMLCTVWERDS